MGERTLQNRIMKLREIEAQQKALEEQAEQIILSSKLDGKALKAALPEIYGQYCKASASRRFTIV